MSTVRMPLSRFLCLFFFFSLRGVLTWLFCVHILHCGCRVMGIIGSPLNYQAVKVAGRRLDLRGYGWRWRRLDGWSSDSKRVGE